MAWVETESLSFIARSDASGDSGRSSALFLAQEPKHMTANTQNQVRTLHRILRSR